MNLEHVSMQWNRFEIFRNSYPHYKLISKLKWNCFANTWQYESHASFELDTSMQPLYYFTHFSLLIPGKFEIILRVVQMGVHFTFEFNLGDRRRRADPTRKLGDVIFNRFSIDLDMSHYEISITSQRIEFRNSGSELPSGLPLSYLLNVEKSIV